MSQPVKLSDELVLQARIVAGAQERSIASQVEYWAKLGRSVADLIDGRTQQRLTRHAGAKSLSALVESVGEPEGQARLQAYLDSEPFPHFEPHPERKGLLIRTDADGRKTLGRFKNRQFIEIAHAKPARATSRPALRAAKRAAAAAQAR